MAEKKTRFVVTTKKAATLTMEALRNVADGPEGATLESLTNYITQKYHVPEKKAIRALNMVLRMGKVMGAVSQKKGKFMLRQIKSAPRNQKTTRSYRPRRRRRRKIPCRQKSSTSINKNQSPQKAATSEEENQ